ncbi:hypothetical protein [Bacillus kexueae]|uniref:hypothetical protein n=1 Tax=Aeribacillus kexueae TaxID=2078952 RepID=UPI001FB00D72|nr:hypothetical protein [Bacillus kexueae]
MAIIHILFLALVLLLLYNRYVPVRGIQCLSNLSHREEKTLILDVRDYTKAHHTPVSGAVNIPIAYLKRNYGRYRKDDVIVVAESHIEKNLSIRFLTKKGINVVGYQLLNRPCCKQ